MQISAKDMTAGAREFRTEDGKIYRDLAVKGRCVAVRSGFGWAWRRCSPAAAAECEASYVGK